VQAVSGFEGWRDRHRAAAAALAWGAIGLASLCLLAPGAYRDINIYDEGVSVFGALRVAGGAVPYRDFWTIYAPGDLYLLAGLFKLFGASLIVERNAWVVLEAVQATLVFAIGRRLAGGLWGAWGWVMLLMWTRQVPFWGSPGPPAMVCMLGAIVAVLAFLDRPPDDAASRPVHARPSHPASGHARTAFLVIAGLLVGVCVLLRQDFGGYAFVSLALTLAIAPPIDSAAGSAAAGGARAPRRWRSHTPLRHPVVMFAAVTAITVAPAFLLLVWAVPVSVLIEQFIVFPLHTYPLTRAMPWPGLPASPLGVLHGEVTLPTYIRESARSVQFYVSIGVLSAAAIWSAATLWRQRGRASAPAVGLGLVAATGVLLLNHARVRSDIFHIYPAFVFTLIVAATGLAALARSRGRWGRLAIATPALVLVVGLTLLAVRSERLAASKSRPLAIPRAAGLSTMAMPPDYDRAIAYVQQVVPPGEPIFVGNSRHDRISTSDVLFYFLAARASATRYHDMHPGVVTTAHVQEEIVRELEQRRVHYVVLWDAPQSDEISGAGSGAADDASTRLDRYIASHFTAASRFGDYEVRKRTVSAP
jgi:hypothetical protein